VQAFRELVDSKQQKTREKVKNFLEITALFSDSAFGEQSFQASTNDVCRGKIPYAVFVEEKIQTCDFFFRKILLFETRDQS